MSLKAGLIDYGRGNLHSVEKALQKTGAEVKRIASAADFHGVDVAVLPGVGAFGDAMTNLRESGLDVPTRQWLDAGKPFLGICLGFQLLFESSEETPGVSGLGWLPGRVVRFQREVGKIPHMGWNEVEPSAAAACCFAGMPEKPYFYHVHSFYPEGVPADAVACTTDYSGRFVSGILKGCAAAFQFHPEKSQANGLALLKNTLAAILA